MPFLGGIAAVRRRQRAGLDIRLVRHLEDRAGGARTRHAATLVSAVDAREADVIVQHELPHLGRIVGPGAMQLAVIVAITRDTRGIHHRPVGHVAEQAVRIIFQIFRLDDRRREPHALRIDPGAITFLDGVTAAQRRPAAAVHELAADIVILVDDKHGGAKVAGPDCSVQTDASRPEHHDIGVIVPGKALWSGLLRRRLAGAGEDSRTGYGTFREEIAPAQ